MAAEAVWHKYDVKSGIVTLESVMKIGKTEIKQTMIVYFDDFGAKECKETYQNGKLVGAVFSDGQWVYGVDHTQKTANKKEKAYRGTELRVDITDMGTQQDVASGKVKKAPPMTVAGKECEVIQANKTLYAGWKKVMVYMQSDTSSMVKTTMKASKIEENASVPASKFQVPAGYKLQ
jgi:VCBS repeat-containing protein